jgi:hypothetical protein
VAARQQRKAKSLAAGRRQWRGIVAVANNEKHRDWAMNDIYAAAAGRQQRAGVQYHRTGAMVVSCRRAIAVKRARSRPSHRALCLAVALAARARPGYRAAAAHNAIINL